jgi:branched-chain amino acid transport system ATP-binding protein
MRGGTPHLLELKGVHTHIGAYHILHGVDLAVPRGELTMLLGRNGAGKTTTLRTIMGLWQPSQGSGALWAGRTSRACTRRTLPACIAYVPENMGIFADLTVKENMLLAARKASHAGQMDQARLEWIFKLFPALEKFWNHPAGKLSGGQKQMLAVSPRHRRAARAAPRGRAQQGSGAGHHQQPDRRLRELKKSGVTTILLVEQNFSFAKRLGDTVAVMDNGRVVHSGRMADLAADEALQQSAAGTRLWEVYMHQ